MVIKNKFMQRRKNNKNIKYKNFWAYINQISPEYTSYSMNNIMLVAKKLNLLQLSAYIITVAGTNGKGSTCCFLENVFLNSGYKTGLYTSPHLFDYTERIKINGRYIKNFMMYNTMFQKIELARGNIVLTKFDYMTLIALLFFQKFQLEIVILEVGIGGRLDPVNIICPNIAVITNIGLDHVDLLGHTRNSIGYEKSGIFRKRIPVVIGDINIPYSVYYVANTLKVNLYRANYEWYWENKKKYWIFYDTRGVLKNLPIPKLLLPNVALAISVLRISNFNIRSSTIQKSLYSVFLIGRFQVIYNYPTIIVDVAHNAHAAKELQKKLQQILLRNCHTKIYAILGMLHNKDIQETICILSKIIHLWYYVPLKTVYTAKYKILKRYLPTNSIGCVNVKEALTCLINKIDYNDVIIVFGSFLVVAEVINVVNRIKKK